MNYSVPTHEQKPKLYGQITIALTTHATLDLAPVVGVNLVMKVIFDFHKM